MKVILCMLIDRNGKIKYVPQYFKPHEVDICVSNYKIGVIGNKTVFYTLLEYNDEYMEQTCWTTNEVLKRCKEHKDDCVVKIFTRINDFYKHANEIQFAFTENLESFDEQIEMEDLIEFCKTLDKQYLGEMNGIKFFRYTKKNI
ncbi:MAG: hypothetical protein ACRC1T_09005 [Clostridium chrysemydis]|uniref:hypothetical protein n=1 Tax=Clostridium chrysemydis TaxID=2665504 RepID=UPI003F3BF450